MRDETVEKDREKPPEDDEKIVLKAKEQAQSPKKENQGYHEDESRDYTEDY